MPQQLTSIQSRWHLIAALVCCGSQQPATISTKLLSTARLRALSLRCDVCVCAAALQEIPVHKLARGSRTDLLELLQYLYKYLLSECCEL